MNKIVLLAILSSIFFLSLMEGLEIPAEKTWTFEIKSVTCKSADPAAFSFDLRVERVSRGVYAISGELNVNIDIEDGDGNMILAESYRSSNGDGDYATLPFHIPPTPWTEYLNTIYKDTIMKTLKDCSDLPAFEDKFEPPLEKKIYKLNKCQFTQDGFPNHLQDGFYKVIIAGIGDVEWDVELIAEISAIN